MTTKQVYTTLNNGIYSQKLQGALLSTFCIIWVNNEMSSLDSGLTVTIAMSKNEVVPLKKNKVTLDVVMQVSVNTNLGFI